MKLIDHIRLNPICFNNATDKFDFDASSYVHDAVAFDISEVADQLIETIRPVEINGVRCTMTTFTQKYHELVRQPMHETGDPELKALDMNQFVGIIPPFDSCFFEYATHKYLPPGSSTTEREYGVHLASMPLEYIEKKVPDYEERGITFVLYATVFCRLFVKGRYQAARETVAYITADAAGRIVTFHIEALLPDHVDGKLPQNCPQQTPIIVLLVALMMLNSRMLKSTLVDPPPKSRQQRRYEQRHPEHAAPPPVQYYTLEIDLDKTQRVSDSPSKKGGWEQAWHQVRAHVRHLRSGKVVPVRPHSRGNPLKGVILKDYKATANQGNAA